jgi:outer membrane protein assembly factor BamB
VCLNLLLLAGLIPLLSRPLLPAQQVQTSRSVSSTAKQLLYLQWVRESPAPLPAWPDQPKLQFDVVDKPVVTGSTVFVGSSRTDSLVALDVDTGAERWRFFADGPIRLAPAVWEKNVYVASDDGYLYCLDGASGRLNWKFRGGPSDRAILGNGRLISSWPARGGPATADGVVYFAAGIWPFMGVFLHALDARSGDVIWTNDGDGSVFIEQPHYAESFAGIAPQGSIVVAGDKLLVPNGRSAPACYERSSGKQIHFRLAANTRGGSEVAARAGLFCSGGAAFDLATGESLGVGTEPALLTDDRLYCCADKEIQVYDCRSILARKEDRYSWTPWTVLTRLPLPVPRVTALAQAGTRLYGGAPDRLFAIDLQAGGTGLCFQAAIEGTPGHLLTTGDRLYVATREGRLYCFGPERVTAKKYPLSPASPDLPSDVWTAKASAILKKSGVANGYCIAWGAGSGRLVSELARQSRLRIIVIEPDIERADQLRKRLTSAGIHGERVAVWTGGWDAITLPPYLASLMVSEDLERAGVPFDTAFVRTAFAALRPFDGVACWPVPGENRSSRIRQVVSQAALVNARLQETADGMLLAREGPLPGSANWTHEHADAANTRVSRDQLVKAPLGLLWFGGPSHEGVLPRHGHGPQPQVIDGRLIIEGADMLRAIDIYTGRKLWETRLPGLGREFDELWHQPGANGSGTNYISMSDGIYVAYGKSCLRLRPSDGTLVNEFHLPWSLGGREGLRWSYINVAGDYLIAGVNAAPKDLRERSSCVSSSKYLVVTNRHSGKLVWTMTARNGFRHNAICAGGGRLYAIDRPTSAYVPWRRDTVASGESTARLVAIDLTTGRVSWSRATDVFGTWLSYSAEHDVLVETGRPAYDSLYDEVDGMRAYRAERGSVLWHEPRYRGPAMIHGDIVLKDRSACYLLTGAPVLRQDPLTGQRVEWTWTRDYGCNTPLASEHLLTFRSGAAGYFDLAGDGGTGNFGGFRSGCTNNLIVAGGVLAAADYTRTCTCSYQNQTSLALVHMPEAEMWTYFGHRDVSGPIRRVGINLGAPGNRKADNGTLWLEYPRAGGPSPRLPVTLTPNNPTTFRHHDSWVKSGELKWVCASGVRGLTSLTVDLAPAPSLSYYSATPAPAALVKDRRYTVRLHFVEPDGLASGERLFDVFVQGRQVLRDFDICREAGGVARAIVKEFKGVAVTKDLIITLAPSATAPKSVPVLCGVEVVADGW